MAEDAPTAARPPASSSTTSRAARCTSDPRRMWAGTCCSASTTARRDASWCGGCTRSSTPAGRRPIRRTTPGSRSRSPITASRRSACRRTRSTASRRSSSRGWRRARPSSATSARAAPSTGRSRSGPPTSTSRWPRSRPTRARLEAVAERARNAHEQLPGVEVIWRQDCYQLPTGRTSFGFKDGIGQPAVEGSGIPPTNPKERPLKAGEIILGYPDETGELPPMPTPEVLGRNGTYVVFRKLHTRVAAYRQYLHAKAASREEEALLGAKMVGRWQSGAPLALSPERDDPELGADPRAQQRLPLRRRPAWIQVPGRRARAPRQPAGRPRRRGKRQRPPPPHDPPRHELRADAARGRARGRRRRPRDHLRVRRRAPEAPVRVRQDPVAERRHLHRRPAEKDPLVGPNDGSGSFTIPQRPIRRRLQDLPPFVVTRGGEYCFAPGLRALRWLAELTT